MNTCQDRCHIVRWAPPILEDIQTELARAVDVRVEHLTDKLDPRRLIRVLLFKVHHEAEGAIFERGVRRANNNGIPIRDPSMIVIRRVKEWVLYQVMTLSAIGDADTPAGGSVCIRWKKEVSHIIYHHVSAPDTRYAQAHRKAFSAITMIDGRVKTTVLKITYLKVTHETAAS